MSSYETCRECDSETGRAGASEDSLYHSYVGPFCEDCYDDWPDKIEAELAKVRREFRDFRAGQAVSVPNSEYIRALQDAFDIIQADANTEENYGSLCRIGSVLGKLKDTPTNADVWIKCTEQLPTEDAGTDLDMFVTIGTFKP